MTKRLLRLGAIAPLLLLAACSSTPPEPTLYLMRGEPGAVSAPSQGTIRAGLGRIIVAPYLLLDQGVMVETAPGQIRPARYHMWAEPLDAGVRWYLQGEIEKATGYDIGAGLTDRPWDYTIDVFIRTLHGTLDGSASIEAAYTIRGRAQPLPTTEYGFAKSTPLQEAGYAALARAQESLVRDLAGAIAGSLGEIPEAPAGSSVSR